MIRCIAIDDEPLALKQISKYIEKTPFLDLCGQFESAFKAMAFLNDHEIDLMFVDINMPDLNGMDFVKSLNKPVKVIFTTAYSEYALDGFKVDAVDYLLKPISFSNFLKAAEKAKLRLSVQKEEEKTELSADKDYLFIKSEYKVMRINYADIKYIEGMREYVCIHIETGEPVMTLMSMKKMEGFLKQTNFMRVHRSYIVNLDKITTIERNQIVFGDKVYITISDQYKEKFQEFLNRSFLS